jgi:hypothetical protein
MRRWHIILPFSINGLISLIFGMLYFFFAGIGDPPGPNPLETKLANLQLGQDIIIFSLVYLVLGLGLSFYWQSSRMWLAYCIMGVASLHSICIISLIIFQRWDFNESLLIFLVPILINSIIIWIVWTTRTRRISGVSG